MALPKMNTSPRYELSLPSTGETYRYRPFLVKEEKILLIAMESQNAKDIYNAIMDTITNCVPDLDASKLSSFDVEYVFLMIRAKSVGESVDLNFKCSECETPNEVSINLESIKIDNENPKDKMIKLSEDITLEMKYPTYRDIMRKIDTDDNQVDQTFKMIAMCMAAVHTEEERTSVADESDEEVQAFVESLGSKQLQDILAFIDAVPKLSHTLKYTCVKCEHENEQLLEGLQDFF